MQTLNRLGKERFMTHHLKVPYHVLDHQYGFDSWNRTESAASSDKCYGNKIIYGDNLSPLIPRDIRRF